MLFCSTNNAVLIPEVVDNSNVAQIINNVVISPRLKLNYLKNACKRLIGAYKHGKVSCLLS